MKRDFILAASIIFFFFNIDEVYSQNYFSSRYKLNNDSGWDFSENITSETFGYTLQLEDGSYFNPYQRRIGFIRLDSMGNQIQFLKIYQDNILSLGSGHGGSFIKLANNSGYALVGYKSMAVSNGRWDRGVLWRFNNNLDSLWTKTYGDNPPYDSSFMFQNFRELTDDGFIITAGFTLVTGNTFWRIKLVRTDSLGNIIWSKFYGSGNIDYVSFDVTPTSDGGYAIGGGSYPFSLTSQDNDPVVIKTDVMGNQQWLKHLGNPNCEEEFAMVDIAIDGNIQCGSTYSDSCKGDGIYYDRINLIKIRNDESIVWDKKYGLSKLWLWLNKIKILSNGDIISTGTYYYYNDSNYYYVGWILKTDSAGTEQWYREYSLLHSQGSYNELYNIIQTNDNGFAACGSVDPTPPDTGIQNSWVLKVDSLGCQGISDCWVGNNEIIVKTFTPDKPYVVYPNPASDKITIEFHENSKGADIEIFDQFGRSQYRSKLSPNKDQVDIDISRWKPGLYVVKVILDERILGTDKIMKF
jgi:hypothetical protein